MGVSLVLYIWGRKQRQSFMNVEPARGLFKHIDFIILDIICLQLCFVVAYWIISGYGNPYTKDNYSYQAEVLALSQLVVIVFGGNYGGILRRNRYNEFIRVVSFTIAILVVDVVLLFLVHTTIYVSRLQTVTTLALFVFVDYIVRVFNKRRIRKKNTRGVKKTGRSLVLITKGGLVDEAMHKLTGRHEYMSHFVSGIMLTDGDMDSIKRDYKIPVVDFNADGIERLRTEWVDEVLVLQSTDDTIDKDLLITITEMGITIHFTLALLNDTDWPPLTMNKLGSYKVLTSSPLIISAGQAIAKRTMDIVGALVGCMFTCILFIFVAPAIYIKSPGPIFFKQKRVGLNGRIFDMYKFRSMYLDAEERKAALMEQNKLNTDLFFKIDDDPRIIGSERKGRDGKPKGIGNFIRKTSIDEFPQFFNVLKGDMSLVGTRPPLLTEWENYDIHHRARMTVKPGITGLWQISGRSEITDFEEVVRLDREYIENWSLLEDLRIILKTIVVVIGRKGAE